LPDLRQERTVELAFYGLAQADQMVADLARPGSARLEDRVLVPETQRDAADRPIQRSRAGARAM
jgi:hypothetical protein